MKKPRFNFLKVGVTAVIATGLSVVGIYSPEFASERVGSSVEAEVQRRGLHFPHLLDDDHPNWNALGNEYWPLIYVVDRCERIRVHAKDEVHAHEARGRQRDEQIETLLRESANECGQP